MYWKKNKTKLNYKAELSKLLLKDFGLLCSLSFLHLPTPHPYHQVKDRYTIGWFFFPVERFVETWPQEKRDRCRAAGVALACLC